MLDKSWKEKFNEIALAQGKERYMGNRVADLKKDGDHYSAGILGRERRNVSLVLKDGKPIRMICSCPKAKSGSKCEHMAALLYALEAQFHPEDDPKKMAEKERLERQKALVLQAEEAKKREEQKKKKLLEEYGSEEAAQKHLAEKYGEMANHPVVKMSKSLGNVVNPDETIDEYGADTMRLYEMFIGDFEKSAAWSPKAIKGCRRFVERIWNLFDKVQPGDEYSEANMVAMHRTIQKVSEDIENLKMNTAIAQMMTLLNQLTEKGVNRAEYKTLLALLNPFAPHVTEELWQMMGETDLLSLHTWPSFDENKTVESSVTIAVQVNGKVKGTVTLPMDCPKEQALEIAMADSKIQNAINGKNVVKSIVVPNKIINLVVK